MRRPIANQIAAHHPHYSLLTGLAKEIERLAGGRRELATWFPSMLRKAVDDVVDTVNTRRRSYGQLEETEKTYLGTRVEILFRAKLGAPKGRLDFVIAGIDVDMKFTITGNWMIPQEAVGHACLLAALDEKNSLCHLGLFIADVANLTGGANRDGKKSISSFGMKQVHWLLPNSRVEPNFWRTIPAAVVDAVFSAKTGNDKVVTLFREVRDRPISRRVVEETADQKDFMRRIRADGSRGSRNRLAAEGILLLNGTYDGGLIRALGLPNCGSSEFISHKITKAEEAVCVTHGWNITAKP